MGRSRSVIDADGGMIATWPANRGPISAAPVLRDDALYLSYPYDRGHSALTVASPTSNVIRVSEVRQPQFTVVGLVFGSVLTAAGVAMIVDATTRSNLTKTERTTELALSPVMLGPGLLFIGIDIYGLAAPRTERILFGAPIAPR